MVYIRIKWVKEKPYKYLMKTIYEKETKRIIPKTLKYLGRATEEEVKRYYKGKKRGVIKNG